MLLPDEVVARAVRSGRLGCPVCGAIFRIAAGVAELDPIAAPPAEPVLAPQAMHAFLGLSGPGGYVVLVGAAAEGWSDLATLNPGVAIVAVNPPAELQDAPPVLSVVRARIIPLKSRSMRGVVLGGALGADPAWVRDAARVILPGLRVIGMGPEPVGSELELLASADGYWVASRP